MLYVLGYLTLVHIVYFRAMAAHGSVAVIWRYAQRYQKKKTTISGGAGHSPQPKRR